MATGKASSTEAPADRTLVITRVFDAPRRLVFEAWTKKEHLDQWCAPRGFTIPFSEGDLRPGGAWRSLMIAPNGEKYPVRGVYREIVQDELLVFTHTWEEDDGTPEHETVVTVRFADEGGGKTKVILEQSVFKSVESRNGHVGGWTECLDKLGETFRKTERQGETMSVVKKKVAEDYAGREFVIAREFKAPRELVFKAWTDPLHVVNWWGPRGFTNPVCEWDARPGKAIYVVMRAPNGVDYPMGGEFREIVAPERLVFTTGALDEKGNLLFEFLHTVTFVERSAKTMVTILSRVIKTTAAANKYIGGFEAGMTQSLVRLEEFLAKPNARKKS